MKKIDFLGIADTIAKEKNINSNSVLEAIEMAMQRATRLKYGSEYDLRVHIDRHNGAVSIVLYKQVVDVLENPATQILLECAKKDSPNIQIGDFVTEILPPIDFSRIGAQLAKQVVIQKVRESERERQYEEYKDRIGTIVSGIVKRIEYGNVTVDLGNAEAFMRRDESIPREHFRRGDRIRAYIYDINPENRGHQILLSRTHPQFLVKLFKQEVPEIYDGIIEIKCVARDPGSRAKIGVFSRDPSLDPVGSCVGVRGSRVQAVVNELQGEKIDIIPWSEDIASFAVNALSPAEVSKVIVDEESGKLEMIVPEDQLSKAIGRRGQNVCLASMLIGHDIDVLTSEQADARRASEMGQIVATFVDALDVDDVIAHLLVAEGFSTVEEIADVPLDELLAIEGFEDIAEELLKRAKENVAQSIVKLKEQVKQLQIDESLLNFEMIKLPWLIALGESNVKSLKDLADCSLDELIDEETGFLKGFGLSKKTVSDMIMEARTQCGWFKEEVQ